MSKPARIAPYTFELTLDEAQSLLWLAERYDYAAVLWSHAQLSDDQSRYTVAMTESDAWTFQGVVESEDGWLPCCGGTLADKLTALLESIV